MSKTTMRPGACSSCGAAIFWARTLDGKPLPVNRVRARVYDNAGETVVGLEGKPELFYVSHFLTCPSASQHSRGTRSNH